MARTVSIGTQDFRQLRVENYFYIDKTAFIKDWWEEGDSVTLITRPRRFGKTITMSMLDYFFSNSHENSSGLFEGLEIWEDEKFRRLQGTYPVIFLSFAEIKQNTFEKTRIKINQVISDIYGDMRWLLEQEFMSDNDKKFFLKVRDDMDESVATAAIHRLCKWLEKYYGKKVLIFLDEYDTPMQEAYLNQYWDELASFIRTLFNSTFKTNPSMERAIMTGITRVSKESVFSDLNNLTVITTTSWQYAAHFGFTEKEVFAAMDEQGIAGEEKEKVKAWYDGFTFGDVTDIYNPWSIINYLNTGKLDYYWVNTSENGFVNTLLREGDRKLKINFEHLLNGGSVEVPIDEQIIFSRLGKNIYAVWSFLLASGYLKVLKYELPEEAKAGKRPMYTLALTNFEVHKMFENLITDWFEETEYFGEFVTAMLKGDVKGMNIYMNEVALTTFSSFDIGTRPSGADPERFYHGFVLGLLVENAADYIVKSNRESGYGRYDVVLEPKNKNDVAVIMEFKVHDKDEEKDLSDTADKALGQIEKKKYEVDLIRQGIRAENILKYGFAFRGKECLIKKS